MTVCSVSLVRAETFNAAGYINDVDSIAIKCLSTGTILSQLLLFLNLQSQQIL